MHDKKIVVLGVGNILEKDDGIGVYATSYLDANFTCKPEVQFINGGVEGINLLNTFLDNDQIIILDTIMLDDEPGSIYNIPSHELSGLGVNSGGAHEVGVLQVLEMIELLGHEMPESNIIGIVPEQVTFEMGLSECLHVRFENYINTVIHYLEACGIETIPKEESSSLKRIIQHFQHPELLRL